jgi:glycosyltransferase involved in cell wall biosynthesis
MEEAGDSKQFNLLIAGHFDFPFGTGLASRVRLFSLVLKESGINVKVLSLISSWMCSNVVNVDTKGSYRGIDFENTTGTNCRPKFFIKRRFVQIKGICRGFFQILSLRYSNSLDCFFLFESNALISVPLIVLCRLLGVPIIFEVGEWWPIMTRYSITEKKIFSKFILRNVDGFIAISENISQAIAKSNRNIKNKIPVLKVPILADPTEWQIDSDIATSICDKDKYMLWCGDIPGYIEEVKFLIRVMSRLFLKKADIKLRLIGRTTPKSTEDFRKHQHDLGLPLDCVEYAGYISQEELVRQCASAFILLLPMQENEPNIFRFPGKLGEYLASGRPVVASGMGEIPNFLNNGVNAIITKPGDEADFVNGIEILLKSHEYAQEMGKKGQELCKSIIDYRLHSSRMRDFIFNEVCKIKA